MKRCIVFLGKTGSGKDTQADLLEQKYGIHIIRLGDLVRKQAREDKKIASEVKNGELVEDSVVDSIMSREIDMLGENDVFISDGYPRQLAQAHILEEYLRGADAELSAVVYFSIDDSAVRLRLKVRNREDDTPDAIIERLAEFHECSEPVVEYFRAKPSIFIELDARNSVEEIFAIITEELEKKGLVQKTL